MPDRDLDARLDAVERALTDDETDLTDLQDASAVAGDLEDVESRVEEIESRLDDLEAGLQAVRGYAGNVRAVNREVERRASAALAKAEALESTVEDGERVTEPPESAQRQPSDSPERDTARNANPCRQGGERPTDTRNERQPRDRASGHGSTDRDRTDSLDIQHGRTGERSPPSGDPTEPVDPTTDDGRDDSQTEQFIERVRDAL